MDYSSTRLAHEISTSLEALKDAEKAEAATRFFKTGEGEYSEQDLFLGIRVPTLRQTAKQYKHATLKDIEVLLRNQYHEIRLLAVFMMVALFERSKKKPDIQQSIVESYLSHTSFVNNWDLVDSSAYKILGPFLMERDKTVVYQLAGSNDLWERRIAMITCYYFIKHRHFDDALAIAEKLINDREDLIHKAVGWMIREIANRDKLVAVNFLAQHYQNMPRVMLRYAIEKFGKEERKAYLQGSI